MTQPDLESHLGLAPLAAQVSHVLLGPQCHLVAHGYHPALEIQVIQAALVHHLCQVAQAPQLALALPVALGYLIDPVRLADRWVLVVQNINMMIVYLVTIATVFCVLPYLFVSTF